MGMKSKEDSKAGDEAPKRVMSIPSGEFEIEEETAQGKLVITVFGGKGVGKTTASMMFPGSVAAISLDRKTKRIAEQQPVERDVRVYDGRKYFIYDKENFTKSSANTVDYLHAILNHLEEGDDRPDWIILDAMEYMVMLCEGKMRHDNRIGPFEPFGKNPALWRERNTNYRMWHDHAMRVARRGVIYTAYYGFESSENSEFKVPKWTEVVQSESDIVLHARCRIETTADAEMTSVFHMLDVMSSKVPGLFKTGHTYDMHENNFLKDIEEYYRPRKDD